MRIKLDENLSKEAAEIFKQAGARYRIGVQPRDGRFF